MTDEYVHGKVQEALERQAEVRELERMAKLPDGREEDKCLGAIDVTELEH